MCPRKEGGRELNDGKPPGDLDEGNDTTDSEATDSSGDEADGNIDQVDGATGVGFEPQVGLKASARLDALKRDNQILQEVVRRQDEVLEEMDRRIKEIQEATRQRQVELQALRAARLLREAAAAAQQPTTSEAAATAEEATSTSEACTKNDETPEKVDAEVSEKAGAEANEVVEVDREGTVCSDDRGGSVIENADDKAKDKLDSSENN